MMMIVEVVVVLDAVAAEVVAAVMVHQEVDSAEAEGMMVKSRSSAFLNLSFNSLTL